MVAADHEKLRTYDLHPGRQPHVRIIFTTHTPTRASIFGNRQFINLSQGLLVSGYQ